MRYLLLLLCLNVIGVLSEKYEVVKKKDAKCPAGGHGSHPIKRSKCDEFEGQCFHPACQECKNGVVAKEFCNNKDRHCCLCIVNSCENNGGECVDPKAKCDNKRGQQACPGEEICCADKRENECEGKFKGECFNRAEHPECKNGWKTGLCGGPAWVQCCPGE